MHRTPRRTGRPVTMAPRGLVVAPHYLATEAGVWIMRQGGNAVDAAVAASAVLSVVYPHLAGLGGDVLAMVWDPRRGEPICLNGSGHSGYQARIGFYTERGYQAVPERGALAANTVPGAVAAWGDLHDRWGALDWERLLEPAIGYAADGFPVSANLARWLLRGRQLLEGDTYARQVFLRDGETYGEGEVLVQADLAQTLRTLAGEGPEAFYRGELAGTIVSGLRRRGGLLLAQDLEDHHSDWVDPLSTPYRDCTLYEFPPNAQGAAASLMLNLLEGWDIASLGDHSAEYYHLLAEAAKVVIADVDQHLADPNFFAAPLGLLLSKEYAARRRQAIPAARAQEVSVYRSGALVPADARREVPGAGAGTAYLATADASGLAVSLVQSLHREFGAGVVAGNTGVLLQSSGTSFSLEPADPNRLEPHKRPSAALIPAMLFRGGHPWMPFGSSGGQIQPQVHATLVTRTVDLGYDVQEAIEAPRVLYGRLWDEPAPTLHVEGWVPDSVLRQLREMGHEVRLVDDWSDQMGQAQAIIVDREHHAFHGGADPRGDGAAAGW